MIEPRFFSGQTDEQCLVFDIPGSKFWKLPRSEQDKHILVEISTTGAISPRLAQVWVKQITDQLNEFDVANATVAKLK